MISPKKAYNDQAHHAKERGIDFVISYSEWLEMWLVSGKWEERGKTGGSYQMCRIGDIGPYSVRNCYIDTTYANQRETRTYTKEQHQEMNNLYLLGESQREIGSRYGITQSSVSRIINGNRRARNG